MSPRTRSGRRRARTDHVTFTRIVLRALPVLIAFVALAWTAINALNGVPGRHYRTAYANVPDAGNLVRHDFVRLAGVRVGQVQGRTLTASGQPRLALQLDGKLRLPADTTVMVRANGLLGGRYVQLVPGHSATLLADGATIKAAGVGITYGLPDALDTFDAETRGGLGHVVNGTGEGLLGHGSQLNRALQLTAPAFPPFHVLAETITADGAGLPQLVPALDGFAGAVAPSAGALSLIPAAATGALAPFVQERSATRDAIGAAPGALTAATTGLGDGRGLLQAVDGVADQADQTLQDAPSSLARATRLLQTSRSPLTRARPLVRDLAPTSSSALEVTKALKPLLGPLDGGLRPAIPMLDQIAPYACDIENFGVVFRSMTGFGGTGEGPNGPLIAFRLQVLPSGQALGTSQGSGLKVEGYAPPCAHPASVYPSTAAPTSGLGR